MKLRSSHIPVILIGIVTVVIAVGLFLIRDGLSEQYVSENEVNLPPASSAANPSPNDDSSPKKVVIISDSYAGGSGEGGMGEKGWPALVSNRLRDEGFDVDLRLSGQGGSGYAAEGSSGTTFVGEAARLVEPDDDVVLYFGSLNDGDSVLNSPGELQKEVSRTLQDTHKTAPNAKILVVPPPLNPLAPADQQQVKYAIRDILREQARLAGVGFSDPIEDGWFADRPDLFGAFHPNDAGHVYLADKFEPMIADLLRQPHT